MESAEKSGKVKMTFEVEINQAALELIKQNMENMSEVAAQGMQAWRENRDRSGKSGYSHTHPHEHPGHE
jgi:hypothetical protein